MYSIFFYHAHDGFTCGVCWFSRIRHFIVLARVYRCSENILIGQYFVSICITAMTGVSILLLYLLDIFLCFFLIFDMKNISYKNRSFDFWNLVFVMLLYGFVEELGHKNLLNKVLNFKC